MLLVLNQEGIGHVGGGVAIFYKSHMKAKALKSVITGMGT